jgi:hypothetical protein
MPGDPILSGSFIADCAAPEPAASFRAMSDTSGRWLGAVLGLAVGPPGTTGATASGKPVRLAPAPPAPRSGRLDDTI